MFRNRKAVDQTLEDRMKENYENVYRIYLPRRMPVVIRLDGKAFHTFTHHMKKPFDSDLMILMRDTARYLMENIQNCVLGYTQSDEISLLLMNYKKFNTCSWFDNNLQKMVSVSAAMASSFFSVEYSTRTDKSKFIQFDSRVFVLPEAEVNNYFLSRQKDCERNAIQMIGQSHYSQKTLHGKKCVDIVEMIKNDEHVVKKYNDYSFYERNGMVLVNNGAMLLEHKFKDNPKLVQDLLMPEEI